MSSFEVKIEKLAVGQLATNCYLAYDEKTKECVIIDPGDDGDYIIRRITDLKLKPLFIIATHGHFDHVLAVTELKLAYGIPFLIHEKDLFLLKTVRETAKHFLKIDVDPLLPPDQFIKEGDKIKFGNEKLKVMETPGHTPGGICLISNIEYRNSSLFRASDFEFRIFPVIFTGDLLFSDGVGRTDFSYSSKEDLRKSLEKISCLSGCGGIIYPGHGEDFEFPLD